MAPYLTSTSDLQRKRLRTIAATHVWLLGIAHGLEQIEERRKRIRRWYIRPINISRPISSEFSTLVRDFYETGDVESHREYFRMDKERLFYLFEMVKDRLIHPETHARPITPALRLSMTLKVLASGDSMMNTAKSYRIGYTTAFKILYETTEAIWDLLQPKFLKFPNGEDEWKSIAKEFWDLWQFPLCLGALDGKHVVIKKPANAGSSYFNYKYDHSIVLLAIADANYRFIYVDIGGYGRNSDGGIMANSTFGQALANEATNQLRLPGFSQLPGSNFICPHVFVADDAFALGPHIMKPFGGTKRDQAQFEFDKRLSRARRVVENSFGILVCRWRILYHAICCEPENAEKIIKAVVVLHNFLMMTDPGASERKYAPARSMDYVDSNGIIRDGSWRHFVPPDSALRRVNKSTSMNRYGKMVRDRMKDFFQTDAGSLISVIENSD